MRVALTGRWARGHRTKSPVSSRLAANSLANKQPKTHSRSDTGKGDRSIYPRTHIMIGTENGGRSGRCLYHRSGGRGRTGIRGSILAQSPSGTFQDLFMASYVIISAQLLPEFHSYLRISWLC